MHADVRTARSIYSQYRPQHSEKWQRKSAGIGKKQNKSPATLKSVALEGNLERAFALLGIGELSGYGRKGASAEGGGFDDYGRLPA